MDEASWTWILHKTISVGGTPSLTCALSTSLVYGQICQVLEIYFLNFLLPFTVITPCHTATITRVPSNHYTTESELDVSHDGRICYLLSVLSIFTAFAKTVNTCTARRTRITRWCKLAKGTVSSLNLSSSGQVPRTCQHVELTLVTTRYPCLNAMLFMSVSI